MSTNNKPPKQSLLLFLLSLISLLILIGTLFVPFFELKFLGNTVESISGLDYLKQYFKTWEDTINYYQNGSHPSDVMITIGDCRDIYLQRLDYPIVQSEAEALFYDTTTFIPFMLVFVAFLCLVVGIFELIINKKSNLLNSFHFWMLTSNLFVFGVCAIHILKDHDWELQMLFSDESSVSTKTFIPVILQIIITIIYHIIMAKVKKADVVEALCQDNDSTPIAETNTIVTSSIHSDNKTTTSQVSLSDLERDNLRLLKGYKELLDSGLITVEEFEQKKCEYLNLLMKLPKDTNME